MDFQGWNRPEEMGHTQLVLRRMTGDVVVAVIALVGVLTPLYLSSSSAGRERRALKELADIVAVLPQGLGSEAALRAHLDDAMEGYVVRHQPDAAMRRALRRRGNGLVAGGLVGFLLLTLVLSGILNNDIGGRPADLDSLLPVVVLVATASYGLVGAGAWMRVRGRERS